MRERRWVPYLLGFFTGIIPLFSLWIVGEWIYQTKPELWTAVPIGLRYSSEPALVLPEEVTPQLLGSVLAAEDADFFYHSGIDLYGLARAILRNLSTMELKEGGSTLTQQLARNVYLTLEKTISRKLLEIALALRLEAIYDKYELLAAYLSTVYTGEPGNGLKRASIYYFGKNLQDISWEEAVGLIGLLRSPGLYSPFEFPERFKRRAETVAHLLVEKGLYWEEIQPYLPERTVERVAFAQQIEPWLRNFLLDESASILGMSRTDILNGGYAVKPTLDPRLQEVVNESVKTVEQYNPAVIVVERFTGKVLAVSGSEYNVLFSRRQLGSLIKPLYYLEGFLQGEITPQTLMADIPLSLGGWEPQNFDRRFRGSVTVENALRLSLNVPSVRVYLKVGPFRSLNFIREVVGLWGVYPKDLTVSLGTVESTPWKVLEAFTFIPNGGVKTLLTTVEAITDRFGNVIYTHNPVVERVQAEGVKTMGESLDILRGILRKVVKSGTGVKAFKKGLDIGGKTGTARRDAWFFSWAGKTMGLVSIHWDDAINITGGGYAAPVWKGVVDALPERFKRPPEDRIAWIPFGTVCMHSETIREAFNFSLGRFGDVLSYSEMLEILLEASESQRIRILSEINQRDPQMASDLWNEIQKILDEKGP